MFRRSDYAGLLKFDNWLVIADQTSDSKAVEYGQSVSRSIDAQKSSFECLPSVRVYLTFIT